MKRTDIGRTTCIWRNKIRIILGQSGGKDVGWVQPAQNMAKWRLLLAQ